MNTEPTVKEQIALWVAHRTRQTVDWEKWKHGAQGFPDNIVYQQYMADADQILSLIVSRIKPLSDEEMKKCKPDVPACQRTVFTCDDCSVQCGVISQATCDAIKRGIGE